MKNWETLEEFKKWAKAAAIRAGKTIGQSAIAMIGTAVVMEDVDWRRVASAALLAGVISLLTSMVGNLPELKEETEGK